MTSFMDSIYAGKDRFVQDQERKRQETTRRLFGDALQNKPDALTQLYGVDPATALKAKEQNQGDRVKGAQFMHRAATVLKSAPDDQKPIVYSRLIQEAKNNPNVAEFTQGLPDQYDPSIMQHVDGLIGMAGMYQDPQSSQNGIQSTFINDRGERVGILRNGQTQVLGMNAPNNQIVEGDGGYFGVNKTTLGAAPVQLGGAPAPMAPPRAPAGAGITTDAGMGIQPTAQDVQNNPGVTFDNSEFESLPPIEKAKFNSYVSRKVPFQIVGGKVVAGQSSGVQLRPAPKAAPKADVPSGYRYRADGVTLEAIPGGPADPATKATTVAAKPLPVAAVNLIETAQDSLAAAEGINQMLADYSGRINRGELKVGLLQNLISKTRNATNNSDTNSKNFASLQATLEKMRNQSLTLNKGVQTDGDAQRAWNELMANLNDEGVVKQRLAEIQALNVRAAKLQREKIARIQRNYGGGGDTQAAAPSAPAQPSAPAPAKPAGQALSIEERIARGKYKVD